MYTTEGTVRQRTKGRVDPGSGVFECSDGEVYLTAGLSMISSSWHNMVALLTREGVEGADDLADPKWTDQTWRQTPEAQQIASSVISRFTRTRTKNQVYDITQQHNILSAPMNKVSDVFDNAQLKFLGWFQEQLWDDRPVVWPGSPIRMSETPRRTPLLVSAAGHDTDAVFSSLNGDVVASVNDPKEA
jgi:benzylsuccinate CoA-transferase BbsE subunit